MAPMYDYKAYNRSGKAERGTVEADTARTARLKLKKQGLIVTDIKEKTPSKSSSSGGSLFSSRIGAKDVALMTRQLASLVKAQIPLVEALSAVTDQTEKESLKMVLAQVRQDVNEGSSLAKALSDHPKVFDHIFINMVEAGESSGTLGLVLLKLADLKEAQMRLRSKIVSAMTYPALMMGVGVILVLGIFTFAIPKMVKIFEQRDVPIPPLTQALITMSEIVTEYWMLLGIGLVVALLIFQRLINTKKGRAKWDSFKLRVPIFGELFRMVAVTRFSETMATLLGSGVPILTSLNITKNLLGNVVIQNAVQEAKENITEGQSIADPLKRSEEFPPMVIHMIATGEKTGDLSSMLEIIASTYEEQVNSRVEGMTSLIEPIMIIVLGGFVGLVVFSIFMPLLDMSNISMR